MRPGDKVRRAFFMLKLLMDFFMLWIVVYICTSLKNNNVMTTYIKCSKTNKVCFFQSGKQVYPISVRGNIAKFENGAVVLF